MIEVSQKSCITLHTQTHTHTHTHKQVTCHNQRGIIAVHVAAGRHGHPAGELPAVVGGHAGNDEVAISPVDHKISAGEAKANS